MIELFILLAALFNISFHAAIGELLGEVILITFFFFITHLNNSA